VGRGWVRLAHVLGIGWGGRGWEGGIGCGGQGKGFLRFQAS
jgi:hypothetical protein